MFYPLPERIFMLLLENLIIEKTDDNKYQLVINHAEHGKFILNDTLYETEQDAIQAKYIAEKSPIGPAKNIAIIVIRNVPAKTGMAPKAPSEATCPSLKAV